MTYLEKAVIRRGHPKHIILGMVGLFSLGRAFPLAPRLGLGAGCRTCDCDSRKSPDVRDTR